jgi:hypothetical protein
LARQLTRRIYRKVARAQGRKADPANKAGIDLTAKNAKNKQIKTKSNPGLPSATKPPIKSQSERESLKSED